MASPIRNTNPHHESTNVISKEQWAIQDRIIELDNDIVTMHYLARKTKNPKVTKAYLNLARILEGSIQHLAKQLK